MSTLSDETYNAISQQLKSWTGIDLGIGKQALVESRLHWRLQELKIPDLKTYIRYLGSHLGEKQHFINSLTTNKTDWFRESDHFQYLTDKILPALKNQNPIQIWSAASSTGEEIYSLAICLAEHFGNVDRFRILGSDIDTDCLETAKIGAYKRETVEAQVPKHLRLKYFDSDETQCRIRPDLKKSLKFRPFNLVESEWPVSIQFDIIFLRNVLIYFKPQTVEMVIHRLSRYLKPQGHLIIGASETLTTLQTPVRAIAGSVYKKAA
jgi:chemotaxis methyl-accepting protein methylase